MARKFYTPLSLTGLELQNFTIQNLVDNPSPYGAGHAYYNTVAKELRIYDGTNWTPVGGSIEYGLLADRPSAGNPGRVYATTDTQTLYLDYSGSWLQIGASGSATYVNSISGTSNQIIVNTTTGDVTARLDYNVKIDADLQVGGFTGEEDGSFSVQTANNIKAFEVLSATNPNGQYHGYGTFTGATGTINVNSLVNIGSENASPAGLLFTNPTSGASSFPTVHLEAYGDLALRAGANGNDGNIILYTGSTSGPGTGKVYIGWNNAGGAGANASNQVATIGDISSNGYITSVDTNVFNVSSGELLLNTTVSAPGTEVHITKLELHLADDTNRGAIVAHPSDGSLTVAAINQLNLESHNGDINLTPDNHVVSNGNFLTSSGYSITSGNNIYVKNAIYVGGTDTSTDGSLNIQDASGNNTFVVSASAGAATVDVHGTQNFYASVPDGSVEYGVLTYDTDKNFIVNANQNNLILEADSSNVYIGSVTDGNKVAKISDVQAAAQGLYVLGSVRMATEGPIDITANASGGVGGVTGIANGDRVLVKSQTDATQNGIYIYNSDSQTLVPSTNPVDADIKEGSYTLVEEGTYAAQGWIVTAFSAGASTWTQFSAAGEYTQGNGISISGGVISGVIKENGGLALTSDGFAAYLGAGLTIDGDGAIALTDYSTITKKYSATIGDAATTSFDVTHNFGTQDVQVTIYDLSTYEEVFADVVHTNTSKVTVSFAVAPAADAFRVVVVG